MNPDDISVINVEVMTHEEEAKTRANEERELGAQLHFKSLGNIWSSWSMALGIIAFCVLFISPWTTIPRTNSIVYQSHWIEGLLPYSTTVLLTVGGIFLRLTTFIKEPALTSIFDYFKIYLMALIPSSLVYISSYLFWTGYLQFHHPAPQLDLMTYMSSYIMGVAGLWLILPHDLLAKENFRQKLKSFMLFYLWIQISIILRELLSFLFGNPPFGLQFMVPLIVAGTRELDKRIQSKMVTNMKGIQDEAAMALTATTISTQYSFMIAVRLVGAELSTVCCFVAIDMFLHSKQTYKIVKDCKKITNGGIDFANTEENKKITMLILTELIEGFSPIIYGTGMALAFNGPNSRILSDVKNNYWSEEIENIGPIFVTMSILLGVDTVTAFINFICLWKSLNVNMISEVHRVLQKYGHFIAILAALNVSAYLASKDINFGMDKTNSFRWKSTEGWIDIVNKSMDLTYEEKAELLANINLL